MSSSLSAVICCCLIVAIAFGELRGQDAPAGKAAALRLKDAEVKSLVKQLGGAKEIDREAAVKKLLAAGVPVIPELGDAAATGNRHATDNAILILKAHVEGADPEARTAAFEELRRLSTGTRPAVAATTKKIVDEHKDLRAASDAARLAARERRAERAEKNPAPPKTKTPPSRWLRTILSPPFAAKGSSNRSRTRIPRSRKSKS